MTDQPDHNGATKQRLAIFDLDRTITKIGTFTPFLLSTRGDALGRAGLLFKIAPHAAAYRAKQITRTELKNRMLNAALAGLSELEISEHARRFVEHHLTNGLYAEAVSAIREHKARGDHMILATAAVDFYARLFADALGFDTLIATRTEYTAAGPRVIGENCYGDEKRRRVQEDVRAIAACEIGATVSTFYTDHHSDHPLMAKVDKAIAVNARPKMRRLARAHDYPIVEWKTIHREFAE